MNLDHHSVSLVGKARFGDLWDEAMEVLLSEIYPQALRLNADPEISLTLKLTVLRCPEIGQDHWGRPQPHEPLISARKTRRKSHG